MDEINSAFNEYVEDFKKLSTMEKRDEVLRSIKEFIAAIEQFADVDNVPLEYLRNREILDLKTSDTEDDFLEAEIVYIENAKNLIGQYLDSKN